MLTFFSPLKSMGSHIRFMFVTGVIKFTQLASVANIKDISMCDDFSAICGFTEQDLMTSLRQDQLAKAKDETLEESSLRLKKALNGYHFGKSCQSVYNPCSLFRAFDDKDYDIFNKAVAEI
eukprot:Gregarina_sp_Poly_1__6081@NODE_3209_length_1275_cov_156_341887_g2039_i0_p2_GENE_NODE_3209_length_1275_cov_156_341887_g2039_i0NODE_3209_length_1275_cov_156_341887_g2039_i0_p2_ORF_typecomplete_len121_score18_87AAAATPase_like/PF09820_9/7e20_NODE_3209_length_1275_cov_156_341887_g2039_i0215577